MAPRGSGARRLGVNGLRARVGSRSPDPLLALRRPSRTLGVDALGLWQNLPVGSFAENKEKSHWGTPFPPLGSHKHDGVTLGAGVPEMTAPRKGECGGVVLAGAR